MWDYVHCCEYFTINYDKLINWFSTIALEFNVITSNKASQNQWGTEIKLIGVKLTNITALS